MDSIASLKCIYREGELAFQVEALPLDAHTLLEWLEKGLRSTCFLVGLSDARRLETHFQDSKDLPLKARDKHPRKSLADYFLLSKTRLEKKMILVVRGFKKPGQLERSIREVLAKFVGAATFIPVLAVDDDLFGQFRARTNTGGGQEQGAKAASESNACALKNSRAEFDKQVLRALQKQVGASLPDSLKNAYVGSSTIAEIIRHQIFLAARSEAPVLILGDTGTGKEVIAKQIHHQSKRNGKPFVEVNCSAISPELLESELFGYKKGAFTGAVADRTGLWQTADDGTIFLDEIGEMDLRHQAKVLRVLAERTFKPIGVNEYHKSTASVIAATNRNLTDMIRAGTFREDLYFRLSGSLIRTSPLREHPEDIPELAQHFWKAFTAKGDAVLPASLTKELESLSWTGNVRDIKMVIQRLQGLVGNDGPSLENLHLAIYLCGRDVMPGESSRATTDDSFTQKAEFLRHLKNTADIVQTAKAFAANLPAGSHGTAETGRSPRESLEDQVQQLDTLARNCLLFHSRAAYEAVLDLKEKLRHFLGLGKPAAAEYRRKTLNREFERCISALFDEVGAIVGG